MKLLLRTPNKSVFIDPEDFERLSKFKWYYVGYKKGGRDNGYAWTKINKRTVRMHRLIINCPENLEVDHINRNGLDNRKKNLRIVTHRGNMFNLSLAKNNKSGVRGVHLYKKTGKWTAQLQIDRKGYHLGFFDKKIDAIEARKTAEKAQFIVK